MENKIQEPTNYIKWPESTNVISAARNNQDKTIRVTFKNGAVYDYLNVPDEIWIGMVSADSVGSFIAKSLKGKYKAERFN